MHVVIIGGTGHVGTYLVPWLVSEGFEVSCVTRNIRKSYQPDLSWERVKMVQLDRTEAEKNGNFTAEIRKLHPDIIIDMICFEEVSVKMMVHEFRNSSLKQYLQCGSMWVHGYGVEVPVTESDERHPLCEYGKKKLAIEKYLLQEYQQNGFPATVLHPGHITGQGWTPINPAGNLNREVFRRLANGGEVILPDNGLCTLHHVHASDVAQAFVKSIKHRENATGQAFHVVSPRAITLRGYAEQVASWYGRSAHLTFLPWEEWKETVSAEDARITQDHLIHSISGSIEKAKRLIHYSPRYTSPEAIKESIFSLPDENKSTRVK